MASESSPLLRVPRTRGRTSTSDQNIFTRPFPSAVIYDLTTPDQATIKLPPDSTWTSGPHWHDTHTEFLQVLSGRADIVLGLPRRNKTKPIVNENGSSDFAPRNTGDDANDSGADKANSERDDDDDDDDDGYHHLPAVGPLDGVIIVPKGTVHEWRRSTVDGLDEELVVKEWTDPKDGEKEMFFRNLNGIILDALREQGELDAEAQESGPGRCREAKMGWRMRTLDLELNNLFWRMDNWPLVLEGTWWPGWVHGLATRCVLLGSAVLGSVLGCRGVYEEYETRR